MKRTLFEISTDALALQCLLEELEGDISDQDVAEAIDEWLNETSTALENKLDGYASLIMEHLAKAKARKEEAKRLTDLARTDENLAKRLRERLQLYFEEHGIEKQETARFKFSMANNGGKAPLILDEGTDPFLIPERYQEVGFDSAAIRAALESGETLGFAQLGERGKSLRIR